MQKFINLSSILINKSYITYILKKPNKYIIYVNKYNVNGFTVVGNGQLYSNIDYFEICEKNNKNDFDIITNFIQK